MQNKEKMTHFFNAFPIPQLFYKLRSFKLDSNTMITRANKYIYHNIPYFFIEIFKIFNENRKKIQNRKILKNTFFFFNISLYLLALQITKMSGYFLSKFNYISYTRTTYLLRSYINIVMIKIPI